jgi:hypothetical protein
MAQLKLNRERDKNFYLDALDRVGPRPQSRWQARGQSPDAFREEKLRIFFDSVVAINLPEFCRIEHVSPA